MQQTLRSSAFVATTTTNRTSRTVVAKAARPTWYPGTLPLMID